MNSFDLGDVIIKFYELNDLLKNDNCAFLCGNGFSINFDNDFADIYSNLYSAHKELIYNSNYVIKANSKFKNKFENNYKKVLNHIKYISENKFYKIFEDALIFANTIIKNKDLINELKENKMITKMTFGLSELDILKDICRRGDEKSYTGVNIENWSILIYFYHSIDLLNTNLYEFPKNNLFITLAKLGNTSNIKITDEEDAKTKTLSNGFITYYRFLFSIAIFSKGKSIYFKKLKNTDNLNLKKIKEFLKKFDLIMTLNFDLIIENLINESIEHLHGKFVINQEYYVYNQRLILQKNNDFIDLSDILIGDYFIFKTFLSTVNQLASNENNNKKLDHVSKKLKYLIGHNLIEKIVIFGMNIENDYHILRNLMISMYFSNIENPEIIYCYFNEKEKLEFEKQFKKVITYSDKLNDYSNNITRSFIKTQDILNNIFMG